MQRLISIVGCALLSISFAAQAVIITPLEGVSGQTTPQATFFDRLLAVTVTDDGGAPIAGTQVNFINTDGKVFFGTGAEFSGHEASFTDASGIAVAPGLIGFLPGATEVTISTVGNGAASVTVSLTVVEAGTPRRFVAVSGSGQKAPVNTTYPLPWIAQAFDADGNVVPRAAALFFAEEDQTMPTVTFNGRSRVWVRADGNGIAVSPYFTANGQNGHDEGGVMAYATSPGVQSDFFSYTNMPAGGGSGGVGDGCGRQGKGNGNCGNSADHSGGNGNHGNGRG